MLGTEKLLNLRSKNGRMMNLLSESNCAKSVRILSFPGPDVRKCGPEKLRIRTLFK